MPKTISTEYGRYTDDFKRLAVLLSHHPDTLATEVAESLGIHPVMLYRWRMELKKGEISGKPRLEDMKTEADLLLANQEIKRLKKVLKESQRENDFLKKAKRFFQDQKKTSSDS